jgi:hypothetical protein
MSKCPLVPWLEHLIVGVVVWHGIAVLGGGLEGRVWS